jgi:hypothetical protein
MARVDPEDHGPRIRMTGKRPERFESGGIGRPPSTMASGDGDGSDAVPGRDVEDTDDVSDADPASRHPPQNALQA